MNLGNTEVIMDSLSPEWVKCFDVPYKFEEQQHFRAEVRHISDFDNLRNYGANQLVGAIEFMLHEVVTARDQILSKNLIPSKKSCMIEIAGEELEQGQVKEQAIF